MTPIIFSYPRWFSILSLIFFGVSAYLSSLSSSFLIIHHVCFVYCLSISLGCFLFVAIQFAVQASWSVVVRRYAENTFLFFRWGLPYLVFLFWALPHLFHWVGTDDPVVLKKAAYLNNNFFMIRSAIYIVIWILVSSFFRRNSLNQDTSKNPEITLKLKKYSYSTIAMLALTMTFASFDWIMSLDPHWYSTIFGVYFVAGSFIAAYAFLILITFAFKSKTSGLISIEHFHDLGKMLFGFVAFWTYIAFSQFFIIWYGNIPEETVWFAHRLKGYWEFITYALVLGHFIIPFIFLLSRHIKRNPILVTIAALWLISIHFIDLLWLIGPPSHYEFHWSHTLVVISWLSLFMSFWMQSANQKNLIPVGDPHLNKSLHFENI